jgi:siroheme synthase-like protein
MNQLYPIFLKAQQLPILIVGGGYVGHEKLQFILKNSPNARVLLVATTIAPNIRSLLLHRQHQVTLIERPFQLYDLQHKSLVIVATNNPSLNKYIWQAAKSHNILVNVADTPQLCDFYLGAIVTKGNLKVAISTNGKSPTFAKRFRQLLEAALPEEIDDLLLQLHAFRQTLEGDFEAKVTALNQLTAQLVAPSEHAASPH